MHELRRLRESAAIPALARALADCDPYIRAEAARALGDVNARKSVPQLVRQATDDPHQLARNAALDALDALHVTLGTDIVVAAVTDPNRHVRLRGALAARQTGDPAVIPVLRRELRRPRNWLNAGVFRATIRSIEGT